MLAPVDSDHESPVWKIWKATCLVLFGGIVGFALGRATDAKDVEVVRQVHARLIDQAF
jgi:hypothetical protein